MYALFHKHAHIKNSYSANVSISPTSFFFFLIKRNKFQIYSNILFVLQRIFFMKENHNKKQDAYEA